MHLHSIVHSVRDGETSDMQVNKVLWRRRAPLTQAKSQNTAGTPAMSHECTCNHNLSLLAQWPLAIDGCWFWYHPSTVFAKILVITQYPSTVGWINRYRYLYSEYYMAMKVNELQRHARYGGCKWACIHPGHIRVCVPCVCVSMVCACLWLHIHCVPVCI